VHNGKKNMYIFSIKGKHMVVTPMKEKVKAKTKKGKSLLSLS